MASIWTGAIAFGLVNIPVRVETAVRSHDLGFKLLAPKGKDSYCPVKYERVCKDDGKEVPWDDIVKGFEYEKERFVVLTDEDFDKAALATNKTFEIQDFAPEGEVDPRYFEFHDPDWGVGDLMFYGRGAGDWEARSRLTSFDRPFSQEDEGTRSGADRFFNFDYSMVRYLERNGFDISYGTNLETHAKPKLLFQHDMFLSAGHDEYWTKEMRDNLELLRDSGQYLFVSSVSVYADFSKGPNEDSPRAELGDQPLHDLRLEGGALRPGRTGRTAESRHERRGPVVPADDGAVHRRHRQGADARADAHRPGRQPVGAHPRRHRHGGARRGAAGDRRTCGDAHHRPIRLPARWSRARHRRARHRRRRPWRARSSGSRRVPAPRAPGSAPRGRPRISALR